MRLALTAGAAAFLSVSACGASAPYTTSNSTKLGEAAIFAGAAAAVQIAESVAEARARNNAPVGSSSMGLHAIPQCDNEGQYPCVTVEGSQSRAVRSGEPERDMTTDEVRDYVLAYVNGVRKLHALGPLVRDPALDAFALAGSDELSRDHVMHGHLADHDGELDPVHAELQDSPDGTLLEGLLQDGIGAILVHWMDEAPDGPHRAALMRPEWHKLGAGIAIQGARAYFTVDLSR